MIRNEKSTVLFKLQLEKHFQASIKTLIILCQVFGAAPVNLSISSSSLSYCSSMLQGKFKTKFTNLLHLAWCFLLLSCVVFAIYSQSAESDVSQRFITRILYTGVYLFTIVNTTIIMCGCQYQRHMYGQFVSKLIDIDIELQSCGGRTNYCTLKNFIRRVLLVTGCMILSVMCIDLMYNRYVFKDFVRSITIYILPTTTALLALIEYLCLLHVLKERYAEVNFILRRLSIETAERNSVRCKKDFKRYSVLTFRRDERAIQSNNNLHNTLFNLPYETVLECLRKVHQDLYIICIAINDSFGILLIATVITTFLILCTQMYAFYTFAEVVDKVNIHLFVYTVLWLVLHAGKLYMLLLNNHLVMQQVSIARFA